MGTAFVVVGVGRGMGNRWEGRGEALGCFAGLWKVMIDYLVMCDRYEMIGFRVEGVEMMRSTTEYCVRDKR